MFNVNTAIANKAAAIVIIPEACQDESWHRDGDGDGDGVEPSHPSTISIPPYPPYIHHRRDESSRTPGA